MTFYLKIPLRQIPQEFGNACLDVKRRMGIYCRLGGFLPIDVETFVEEYFFFAEGQRLVAYEGGLDLKTLKGKLLANYVRVPIEMIRVENQAPLIVKEIVTMPFCAPGKVELQSLNVISHSTEYDHAVKVEGVRTIQELSVDGGIIAVEKWDNGVLDVISAKDEMERKPYSTRRFYLEEKTSLKLVPFCKIEEANLVIKDEIPYKAGETGGYARISYNKELAVIREVDANVCSLYVRGSLASNNQFTLVKSEPSIEPTSKLKVLINLDNNEVISNVNFVHDVVDLYNVQYSLPRSYQDIKMRKKEEEIDIVNVKAQFEKAPHGVGFRKRLYVLFYGSRVRLKLENNSNGVSIAGEIDKNILLSFQVKVESFAYANRVALKWGSVDHTPKRKLMQWEVIIT